MGGLQINAEWRQIATQKSTTSLPRLCSLYPLINFGDVQLWALAHYEGHTIKTKIRSDWGLIPSWATDPSVAEGMINARSKQRTRSPRSAMR
jgi:hypothetical protein